MGPELTGSEVAVGHSVKLNTSIHSYNRLLNAVMQDNWYMMQVLQLSAEGYYLSKVWAYYSG